MDLISINSQELLKRLKHKSKRRNPLTESQNLRQRVAENLKTEMAYLQINNSEFAQMVGVSPAMVSMWRNGKALPSLVTLTRIHEAGIPADKIIKPLP